MPAVQRHPLSKDPFWIPQILNFQQLLGDLCSRSHSHHWGEPSRPAYPVHERWWQCHCTHPWWDYNNPHRQNWAPILVVKRVVPWFVYSHLKYYSVLDRGNNRHQIGFPHAWGSLCCKNCISQGWRYSGKHHILLCSCKRETVRERHRHPNCWL